MPGDLFVKAQEGEILEVFAHRMAAMLEIGRIERRESGSYVNGEYYKGIALAVVVKFARAEEIELEGYDFWIHLRPSEVWVENPAFVDGLADLLARRLTVRGEHVVRMTNAERMNSRKIFYELDAAAAQGTKQQVVTRKG